MTSKSILCMNRTIGVRELMSTGITLTKLEESDIVCQQIADILGDKYQAWWEKAPNGNAEFMQFAKDTLSTLVMCDWLFSAVAIGAVAVEMYGNEPESASYDVRLDAPKVLRTMDDPITTLQQLADAKDKSFNRRYYNNPDGLPEFKY